MLDNTMLHRAKADSKDEFYTLQETIEQEMHYHLGRFKGKRVYCNCDDPDESAFSIYFRDNFRSLGLSELVCTSWSEGGHGKARRVHERAGCIVAEDWMLDGDGSFDSDECLALLSACDVVVSNPPFSKARFYLPVLLDSRKDFLVLGSQTWLTMKCMFAPLVAGDIRVGRSITNGSTYFSVPDAYPVDDGKFRLIDGKRCVGVNAIRWFTTFVEDTACDSLPLHTMKYNLSNDTKLRRTLREKWGVSTYLKYDNCDAIDIPVVCGIPSDYDGLMGVPVTLLLNHNPEQFELVSIRKGDDGKDLRINGKGLFTRALVRNKELAHASC